MIKLLKPWAEGPASARGRAVSLVIVVLTSLAMLTGVGQRFVDYHSNLGDAEHLAALSLLMSGIPDEARPVTFLDVDDATRRAWQAEGATPHGALAALVELAATHGASAILLDFNLAPNGGSQPAEPALSRLLENYAATAPDLMLAREIRFPHSGAMGQDGVGPAVAVATPYDAPVAGKTNIHWVTTLNEIGRDRAVRRIRLYQPVCDGAGGKAYPSAALVAAAVADGGRNRAALAPYLDSRVREKCANTQGPVPVWPPVQKASVRLPYVFADTALPAQFRVAGEEGETVALRRISAQLLVRYAAGAATPAATVDRDPFAGRLVVIGASYADSGDVYETPLGTMPGALILANSLFQARAMIERLPASQATMNIVALVLFLALAWIARTFVGVVAFVVMALATFFALFLAARGFGFASAVDVVAVAVPGFAFYKFVDSLIAVALSTQRIGWRAILKSGEKH